MDIFVSTVKPVAVEIGATKLRQLAQEIRTVLATRKGSVPLDRDFGVSWDMIDRSLPGAQQMLIGEIAQQLEKYVPRIKFKSIRFPNPGTEQAMETPISRPSRPIRRSRPLSTRSTACPSTAKPRTNTTAT